MRRTLAGSAAARCSALERAEQPHLEQADFLAGGRQRVDGLVRRPRQPEPIITIRRARHRRAPWIFVQPVLPAGARRQPVEHPLHDAGQAA
jgi:hypothetical protein